MIAPLIVRKKAEHSFEVWFGVQDTDGRFLALDGDLHYSYSDMTQKYNPVWSSRNLVAQVKAGAFRSFANPRGLFGVYMVLDVWPSHEDLGYGRIEILHFTPRGGLPVRPALE